MDIKGFDLIVPVTATRVLQIADGIPIRQTVPEDYALATFVVRAIQNKDDRSLEFLLKSYLPILIVPSYVSSQCILFEYLGFSSVSTNLLESVPFDSYLRTISESRDATKLQALMKELQEQAEEMVKESVTLIGALSRSTANDVTQILEWPERNSPERYAYTIPPVLDVDEQKSTIDRLIETTKVIQTVPPLVDEIESKISEMISVIQSRLAEKSSTKVKRLEARIEALESQIDQIRSRIEQVKKLRRSNWEEKIDQLTKTLEDRESALKRDLERVSSIQSEIDTQREDLRSEQKSTQSVLESVKKSIRSVSESLSNIQVSIGRSEMSKSGSLLLIPIVFAGYTEKGKFTLDIFMPSVYSDSGDRVGRFKSFVDPLVSVNDAFSEIAGSLRKRVVKDLGLRKDIREYAVKNNILSVKTTRELVNKGLASLFSDGLIKESIVDEVKSLLSSIPETSLPIPSPTDSDEDLCSVRFHVRDEAGQPVQGAILFLGGLQFSSNRSGLIKVSMPRSHYDGEIRASGYHSRSIEFSVRTLDDIAIPVVLSQLPYEELLSSTLEGLVERANRIDKIRQRLWDVFESQGETILAIPAYRSVLEELLLELGYDPDVWILEAQKKSGMIQRLLRRDDRQDAIRRDILRIAEDTKQSGGIMLLSELLVHLDGAGWETTNDEVQDVLETLSDEGLIEGVTFLESGTRLVKFIPVALTDDPTKILGIAEKHDGQLTIEDAVIGLGWSEERVTNALALLVERGVAKVQKSYSKSTIYWFPGLRGRKK